LPYQIWTKATNGFICSIKNTFLVLCVYRLNSLT
jgi:hypothetical protein